MKITLIFALLAQIAGGITAPAEIPEAEEKTFYCEYHGEFEQRHLYRPLKLSQMRKKLIKKLLQGCA